MMNKNLLLMEAQRIELKDAKIKIIELELLNKSQYSMLGDLKETTNALVLLVNSQKEQILQLTAENVGLEQADLSKLQYIDSYMHPLKEEKKMAMLSARKAEEIIRLLVVQIKDTGKIIWSHGEILNLIHEISEEVEHGD